jgi:hypothetical protein
MGTGGVLWVGLSFVGSVAVCTALPLGIAYPVGKWLEPRLGERAAGVWAGIVAATVAFLIGGFAFALLNWLGGKPVTLGSWYTWFFFFGFVAVGYFALGLGVLLAGRLLMRFQQWLYAGTARRRR